MGLAALFGVLIGLDREHLHKPAGIRTMMMVSLGAALFTLTGLHLASITGPPGGLNADALSRIVQGVVGGVGFLGAGVIMRDSGKVRGVTTAAGIWVTAGVGIACGLGEYMLATIAGGLAVLTFTSSRFIYSDVEPDEPGADPENDDSDAERSD